MVDIPVTPDQKEIDSKYRRDFHEGEVEYRLRSENRARVMVWYLPLFSISILLTTLLIDSDNVLGITILTVIAFIPAMFAKIAQNQLVIDVRDFEDIRTASHQGRIKRHYDIAAYLPQAEENPEIDPVIIDSKIYLETAANNWNTHLGLLSPTGTGKTTALTYFMDKFTITKPVLFLAIEPKDNEWASLPPENVFRIGIVPTAEQYYKMIGIFNWILNIAEKRKLGDPINFEIVLNLEEYLTTYKQIKVNHSTKMAELFKSRVTALQNVGRSLGIHIVLISQSAVANDLGMSGGERSNMRLMLLGSGGGGFEAIQRGIQNGQLVPETDRKNLNAQYDYWKSRIKKHQSMLMANFDGTWNIMLMPLLSPYDLKAMKINSISAKQFNIFENDTGVDNLIEPDPDFSVTLNLEPKKTEFHPDGDLIDDLFT